MQLWKSYLNLSPGRKQTAGMVDVVRRAATRVMARAVPLINGFDAFSLGEPEAISLEDALLRCSLTFEIGSQLGHRAEVSDTVFRMRFDRAVRIHDVVRSIRIIASDDRRLFLQRKFG